jgi:hypothetical protein
VTEPQYDEKQLLTLARTKTPPSRRCGRASTPRSGGAGSQITLSSSLSASAFLRVHAGVYQHRAVSRPAAQQCPELGGKLPVPERAHRHLTGRRRPGFPNGGIIPDCNAFANLNPTGDALDPAFQSTLLSNNDVFPFSLTKQPFQASLRISCRSSTASRATFRSRRPARQSRT